MNEFDLQAPDVDDRRFKDLMRAAEQYVRENCPDWTDFGPGDPGVTLIEVFAFIAETVIWRANKLPARAYIEFLRMAGITLTPPVAATATLLFKRTKSQDPLSLPMGTAVEVEAQGVDVRYVTLEVASFNSGETTASVMAAHAEWVTGELLGTSSGTPGQAFKLARTPALAACEGRANVYIGVERERVGTRLGDGEIPGGATIADRAFDIWRVIDSFVNAKADEAVVSVDRASGIVRFAPAARLARGGEAVDNATLAIARVPAAGLEIRAWYLVGGGEGGNLPAGALTRLATPIDGVSVENPQPATGGRDAETIQNALKRAPHALAVGDRAVTARDYEIIAQRNSKVARALALAPSELWQHARLGVVELILTPFLDATKRQKPPTRPLLEAMQSDEVLDEIERMLEVRCPLGTQITAAWGKYKPVRVHLSAKLNPLEDPKIVEMRLQKALDRLISPAPDMDGRSHGWHHGAALRTWHINEVARREPAIAFVDDVRVEVPETPYGVTTSLATDIRQSEIWYAASGDTVYRTVNSGGGWERARRFDQAQVSLVAAPASFHPEPEMTGLVVAITKPPVAGTSPVGDQSAIWVSRDCGESWTPALRFDQDEEIADVDFLTRDGTPTLILATERGLREFVIGQKSWDEITLSVSQSEPDIRAVATAPNPSGSTSRYTVMVSVAGRGLFFSAEGGGDNTFLEIGPPGFEKERFRVLRTHVFAGRPFIWAGIEPPGDGRSEGCFQFRISGQEESPTVDQYFEDWGGASCLDIAFRAELVLAATHRDGVKVLSLTDQRPAWRSAKVNCGLPLRKAGDWQPVLAISATAKSIMAAPAELGEGSGGGIYHSFDGLDFTPCSQRFPSGSVTLPPGWLFCAAEEGHVVELTTEPVMGGGN